VRRATFKTIATGLVFVFVGACTEVHVRMPHRTQTATGDFDPPQAKASLSLAELVARQKQQRDTSAGSNSLATASQCESTGGLGEEVRPYNQETASWCWATSAQIVLEFHKHVSEQCRWVDRALSRDDCCGPRDFLAVLNRWFTDTPSACDQGGWPHWVFASSGFDYERIRAPGSADSNEWGAYFDALKTQLCQNGPLISVIRWSEGGGHTQVVRAINTLLQVVEVNDHLEADFNTQPFDVFIGDSADDLYGPFGYSQDVFYVDIRPL